MRKFLLFEFKEAYDGTFFDCPPPGGWVIDIPFYVVALKIEEITFPLFRQYYVYAVG